MFIVVSNFKTFGKMNKHKNLNTSRTKRAFNIK